MPTGRARILSALACCLFLALADVSGQDAKQPTPMRAAVADTAADAGPSAAPTAAPIELKPEMYLLEDPETGDLRQLIGFTLRDFEELSQLRAQRQAGRQPPPYSLQSLRIEGTGYDDHVAMKIELVALVNSVGWVKVPLRLNEASLVSAPGHDGPGKFFVETGQHGDGQLIAWIDNGDAVADDAPIRHTISLNVLAPLRHIAGETRLRLSLPAAPRSELQMSVMMPGAVAIGSDSAARIQSRAIDERQTEFVASGLKPDFELSWRESASRPDTPAGVLEATADVLVRIDGRSVHHQAELRLKNSAAPFSRFRVRLPKGAELVSGDSPGFSIEPVSAGGAEGGDEIEVHLYEPNTTAQLQLVTERRVAEQEAPVELAGFEVVEAVRQWGRVAVSVDDQWQAIWGPRTLVRQVETLPESLESDDLAARFEYFGQPYSLTAEFVQRQTHVAVLPKYRIDVFGDHLEMVATLGYTIRRAKVFQLEVDLADWQLVADGRAISPEAAVDLDQVNHLPNRPLTIPLRESVTGPLEIVIRARRNIADGTKSFRFDLPAPVGDFVEQPIVEIRPATNVEITPLASEIRGLVRQAAPEGGSPTDNAPAALHFHGTEPNARFAADLVIREQTITASSESQVRIEPMACHVEQTLQIDVAHEPAEHLTLELPREFADSAAFESFQVILDGAALVAQRLAGAESDQTQTERYKVPLGGARIGRFRLQISYRVQAPEMLPEASVPLNIALAMPAEGQLVGNELTVSAPVDIQVLSRPESSWRVSADTTPSPSGATSWRLSHAAAATLAPLVLQTSTTQAAGATIVDRTWIHTRFAPGRRQDRVVYRFTTERPTVKIVLPSGVVVGAVRAMLDGQEINVPLSPDRVAEITLPTGGVNMRRHTLELEYALESAVSLTGRMQLSAPRWNDDVWFRHTYWQLTFPAHQHVVWGPRNFVHEYDWRWTAFHWGRTPLLDQSQLKSWSGASFSGPSSRQANHYLYSRISGVDGLSLQTVSRSLGVFVSSTVALLVGLVLIYVPFSRRPLCLLVVAVGLLAVTAVFPEPAILFAQACILGLILALVALAIDRYIARRRGPRMVIQGAARTQSQVGSTRHHVALNVAGSNSSTKAVALVAPASSETKP